MKQTVLCYNVYYMFLHSSSLQDRRYFCAFFRRARRRPRELRGARFTRSPLLLNRRRMLLSIDCIQGNGTSRAIDRLKDTCSICLRVAGKTASIMSPFEHNDII